MWCCNVCCSSRSRPAPGAAWTGSRRCSGRCWCSCARTPPLSPPTSIPRSRRSQRWSWSTHNIAHHFLSHSHWKCFCQEKWVWETINLHYLKSMASFGSLNLFSSVSTGGDVRNNVRTNENILKLQSLLIMIVHWTSIELLPELKSFSSTVLHAS